MKKYIAAAMAGAAMLASTAPVFAAPPSTDMVNPGQAGKSQMSHMDMMPYAPAYEGSYGQISYNMMGDTMHMVLTAKNLEPNTEYMIKSKGNVLATGMTNPAGNLTINADWDGEMDLMDGRINLYKTDGNVRVLWTGSDTFDVFDWTGNN